MVDSINACWNFNPWTSGWYRIQAANIDIEYGFGGTSGKVVEVDSMAGEFEVGIPRQAIYFR